MLTLAEIKEKCDAPTLASRDEVAILAAVNLNRVKTERVLIADVQAYLQTNGLWWVIKAAASDSQNPAQEAAVAVMDVANARYERIDMALPIVVQMFGGLVATGLLTKAQSDELRALGVSSDPVTARDINLALYSDGGEWLGG